MRFALRFFGCSIVSCDHPYQLRDQTGCHAVVKQSSLLVLCIPTFKHDQPTNRFCCRIKQGDLTDPDYFDFISFAQYASVAAAMRNGREIFDEKVGAEGEKRTVQRGPEFKDNARLPAEHAKRVGERILVRPGETGWAWDLGLDIWLGCVLTRSKCCVPTCICGDTWVSSIALFSFETRLHAASECVAQRINLWQRVSCLFHLSLSCVLLPPILLVFFFSFPLGTQAYCTDTFGSTKLGPVVAQGLSLAELQEGCDRVMNLLRLNFYTVDYSVELASDRRLLVVSPMPHGMQRRFFFIMIPRI